MINPSVKQIPIIGGTVYKVGQVYGILSQPCSPVPTITVWAAFANLPMLVWTLVKPDPVDFITSKFGVVHKRRRRRNVRVQAVDIGLPKGGGGIRAVEWASFRFKERIGWYFLVVDATATFAVNWMSMAYLYSGCKDPLSGYGATNYTGDLSWLAGGSHFQMTGGIPDSGPGYFANAANVRKLNPGPRQVAADVTFGTPNSLPHGTVSRVYIRRDAGGPGKEFDLDMSGQQQGNVLSAAGGVQGYNILDLDANYQVHVVADGGWIKVTNWNLTVSGFDQPGIEPDP